MARANAQPGRPSGKVQLVVAMETVPLRAFGAMRHSPAAAPTLCGGLPVQGFRPTARPYRLACRG